MWGSILGLVWFLGLLNYFFLGFQQSYGTTFFFSKIWAYIQGVIGGR
jgi:hypothetical protein